MSSHVRLAAVQAEPVWLDIDATVDKTIDFIRQAGEKDVDLIAFPETWIPGYPVFLWSLPVLEQMPYVARYHANSMTVDGPHLRSIREAVRDAGLTAVVGYSEKANGSLFIAQTIIGPRGQVLLHRRKLKATHAERTLFGESDGSNLAVISTPLGRIGALNCWEHLQPLTKYAMYAQNEEIHIAGWPCFGVLGNIPQLSPGANLGVSRTYALEGGCFVIASTQIMSAEGIKTFANQDGTIPAIYNGGGGFATIFGPDSSVLSDPLDEHVEGIVTADVDLSVIDLAKNVADPAGHYGRPDVTRLIFDNSVKRPVEGPGRYGTEIEIPDLDAADGAIEEAAHQDVPA